VDELQAGIEFSFAVLPEPSALFQPSEESFNHPAFGQDDKSVQFIALDHLNRGLQPLHHAVGKRLAGVAAIDQNAFHSRQIRFAAVDRMQGPTAIRHFGGGNRNGVGQPLRIHPDVPFDPGDLLARVVALLLGAIGVLHALRVNNQEAGHGVASPFGAGLAN